MVPHRRRAPSHAGRTRHSSRYYSRRRRWPASPTMRCAYATRIPRANPPHQRSRGGNRSAAVRAKRERVADPAVDTRRAAPKGGPLSGGGWNRSAAVRAKRERVADPAVDTRRAAPKGGPLSGGGWNRSAAVRAKRERVADPAVDTRRAAPKGG